MTQPILPAGDYSVVFRGELWWADLPQPIGSEPGYRRPVLITQINRFNRSRLSTVLVAIVTINLELAEMPGNVLVLAYTAGLEHDSVVNVTQVATIDRSWLIKRIGALPEPLLRKVEDGLRLIQGL
jgi:mRNA interferase MazF